MDRSAGWWREPDAYVWEGEVDVGRRGRGYLGRKRERCAVDSESLLGAAGHAELDAGAVLGATAAAEIAGLLLLGWWRRELLGLLDVLLLLGWRRRELLWLLDGLLMLLWLLDVLLLRRVRGGGWAKIAPPPGCWICYCWASMSLTSLRLASTSFMVLWRSSWVTTPFDLSMM